MTLITGPANAGKAELVMDAVRRQLAHGREPLLIVPTRADVEHYRRELAGDGAVMGAEVERVRELIATAARALARFIAELQERRVPPARLRKALLAAGGADAPAAALAELFAAYLGSLRRMRRVDEEQRAARALDALRGKPALWGGRPVLF